MEEPLVQKVIQFLFFCFSPFFPFSPFLAILLFCLFCTLGVGTLDEGDLLNGELIFSPFCTVFFIDFVLSRFFSPYLFAKDSILLQPKTLKHSLRLLLLVFICGHGALAQSVKKMSPGEKDCWLQFQDFKLRLEEVVTIERHPHFNRMLAFLKKHLRKYSEIDHLGVYPGFLDHPQDPFFKILGNRAFHYTWDHRKKLFEEMTQFEKQFLQLGFKMFKKADLTEKRIPWIALGEQVCDSKMIFWLNQLKSIIISHEHLLFITVCRHFTNYNLETLSKREPFLLDKDLANQKPVDPLALFDEDIEKLFELYFEENKKNIYPSLFLKEKVQLQAPSHLEPSQSLSPKSKLRMIDFTQQ